MIEIEIKGKDKEGLEVAIGRIMKTITTIVAAGEIENLKEWEYKYEFDLKMKVYHILPPTNNYKLYVVNETETSRQLKFVFRYDTDLKISKSIANVLEMVFPLNVKVL